MKKTYYSLSVNEENKEASIYIFGDIVSWEWFESDVSSYTLAKEIEALPEDIETINVFINSYGGEVAEGLAIYNQLRRHKATVRTHCDGFACSAASIVFMAGDERIMSNASLLMIHNAWVFTVGDHHQLRKEADDMETINSATMQAYLNHINVTEEKLKEMLDAETWISAEDALEMSFATSVVSAATTDKAAASLDLRKQLIGMILAKQAVIAIKPVEKELIANINVDTEGLVEKVIAKLKDEIELLREAEQEQGPEPKQGQARVQEEEPEKEPEKENKLLELLTAIMPNKK